MDPNTSENDSFSAPGCDEYSSPAVYCVTPWVSSCAITSIAAVSPPFTKIRPLPSPYTIWVPFQNALSKSEPKCTDDTSSIPRSSTLFRPKTSA